MELFLWGSSRWNAKQSLGLILALLLLPCSTFAQDEVPDQDALTAQAQSQFEAGQWTEAFSTAGSLASDTDRAALLSDLSEQRSESQQQYLEKMGALAGGISASDFNALINLVTNTISADSWEANGGGSGTIQPYPAGVYVDAEGNLNKIKIDPTRFKKRWPNLNGLWSSNSSDWELQSGLRMVSLTRLEKAAQLLAAQGKPISDAMQNLGGIYEIKYLMMYPATGDIVIAGPAGAWKTGDGNRPVNVKTGKPVLQLDDLVVCLRNAWGQGGKFGCSITPRQKNLAATQQFLATSKLKGAKWSDGIRSALGKQDVEVHGIDPQSHTARVLVEADYRMKLLGMGLEESIPEVPCYFDRVKLLPDGSAPPMDVARWWFTLNYDHVVANQTRTAFSFNGSGVKVLSETEFINKQGQRIHSGTSQGPTKTFAEDFTKHFDALAGKYPVYRQLKNVFDLALVSSLIRREDLTGRVRWHQTFFGAPDPEGSNLTYHVRQDRAATQVDSVMNEKFLTVRKRNSRIKHHMVGVSGGVSYDVSKILRQEYSSDEKQLSTAVEDGTPGGNSHWWWDGSAAIADSN